jgi:hypothetical protein
LTSLRWATLRRKLFILNDFTDELDGGITLARHRFGEVYLMKKNEFSEIASNLLMMGSVSVAILPFLLGDRLILVVSDLMREGGLMINQFGDYLTWLIS